MNRTTCNNVNSKRFIDTVISEDNLMYIGRVLTFTAFEYVERYEYINLSYYYNAMYRDIKRFNTEDTVLDTLSDGYEVLQECMLYLCNFLGRKLSDTYKKEKNGKIVNIRLACLRYTAKYIRHYIGLYDEPVSELTEDTPYRDVTFSEEEYDRADAIFENMHLTRKQSAVLKCYINNMRPVEIAKELDMYRSNVSSMHKRIQEKYIKYIIHYDL